jgi:hypothetical protein
MTIIVTALPILCVGLVLAATAGMALAAEDAPPGAINCAWNCLQPDLGTVDCQADCHVECLKPDCHYTNPDDAIDAHCGHINVEIVCQEEDKANPTAGTDEPETRCEFVSHNPDKPECEPTCVEMTCAWVCKAPQTCAPVQDCKLECEDPPGDPLPSPPSSGASAPTVVAAALVVALLS